jgi:hypothetical protein
MMAKVDEKDSKDWVVAVDMKSAAVEGLAPVLTQRYSPTTLFSPCAFPSYLTKTTPGLVALPCLSLCHDDIYSAVYIFSTVGWLGVYLG